MNASHSPPSSTNFSRDREKLRPWLSYTSCAPRPSQNRRAVRSTSRTMKVRWLRPRMGAVGMGVGASISLGTQPNFSANRWERQTLRLGRQRRRLLGNASKRTMAAQVKRGLLKCETRHKSRCALACSRVRSALCSRGFDPTRRRIWPILN